MREILELPLKDAYQMLLQLFMQRPDLKKKHYAEARFGNNSFDIYTALNELYDAKPKQQAVTIEGKQMTQRDFYTEIEKRETLIKNLLIKYMEEEDISEAR